MTPVPERSRLPTIRQADDYDHIDAVIVDAITAVARRVPRRLEILEAGCGQGWTFDLKEVDFRLTGLDLDPEALRIRVEERRDLDVAIHGDLCAATLPEAAFDIVYSAFVLEHIEHAPVALDNLVRWLAPGGRLILRLPDPRSVRGFVTRFTPMWFHVAFYRHVLGHRNAGRPGFAPYPTYYHPVIEPRALTRAVGEAGLAPVSVWGDGFRYEGAGLLGIAVRTGSRLVAALSLGRLERGHSDLLYVYEKIAPNGGGTDRPAGAQQD
jgi:SAM-dependent methyltransferase